MGWVRRFAVIPLVLAGYVLCAAALSAAFPSRPVLATCVFDGLVAWVFWPDGGFGRRAAAAPRGRLLALAALWPAFWLGTQVTATALVSWGASSGSAAAVARSEALPYVVLTLALAPLAEELFFREFLLGRLLGLFPFWVAVAAQAALFAWAHGSGVHLYVGAVVGVALALVWVWAGDVRVCAAFHAAYNALCVLGPSLSFSGGWTRVEFVVSFNYTLVALLLIAGGRLRRRRARSGEPGF